jgi:hypothetical protein
MLDVERTPGMLPGLKGGHRLQGQSSWPELRRGISQNPEYAHSFDPAGQFGLGVPGPSRALELFDIEHFNGRLRQEPSGLLLGDRVSFSTPSLSHLVEHQIPGIMRAIEASRNILDIPDDWDSEGSVDYSESTWNRATEFLKRTAFALRVHHEREVQTPRILHGPDGGIDLHWKTTSHELLISIPAHPDEPADFYGDSGPRNTIKGKLDTSAQGEWILMWLIS